MGTVHKIGNDYFIEFYARGLKYQQKAGPNRKVAQKALAEIEAKIARGEASLIVRDVDIDIFLSDFLTYCQTQHTPKTIRRFQTLRKHFLSFLKDKIPAVVTMSHVTPSIIERYKFFLENRRAGTKVQGNSSIINLTIILLREIFAYAIKLGYLNDDPSLHIQFVSTEKEKKVEVVTAEEKALLMQHASPRLAMMIEVILGTGISVGELTKLRWSDIDWSNQVIKVSLKQTRDIPMVPRIIEIFKKQRGEHPTRDYIFCDEDGRKLTATVFKEELYEIVRTGGLRREITFDMLCHSFIQELIRKNIPWGRLYRVLGYADIVQILPFTVFSSGVHLGQVYKID